MITRIRGDTNIIIYVWSGGCRLCKINIITWKPFNFINQVLNFHKFVKCCHDNIMVTTAQFYSNYVHDIVGCCVLVYIFSGL